MKRTQRKETGEGSSTAGEAAPAKPARTNTLTPQTRRDGAGMRTQARSAVTREKLCLATIRLLEQKPLRDVRIAELTKLASISPASFYFYFTDISEAVLGALDYAAGERPDWVSIIEGIEPRGDVAGGLRTFIRSFLEYWDKYYGILRARTLASDEGDLRFRAHKADDLLPVVHAIETKIDELRAFYGVEPDTPSPAQALVLMGMLERVGPVLHMRPTRAARSHIINAAVQNFYQSMVPHAPVGPPPGR